MKIIHAWYGRYPNPDRKRDDRNAAAQQSWVIERERCGRAGIEWVDYHADVGRDTSARIGDPQPMPSVHALMNLAACMAHGDDIIFLTNADVGVVSGIADKIIAVPGRLAHLKRRELGLDAPLLQPTEQQILNAPEYCGMDGTRYGWDSLIRNLIRWKGGVEIHDQLVHREHTSYWNGSPDVLYKNPANHQNRLMLWAWILQHGGSDADHLFADGELTYR